MYKTIRLFILDENFLIILKKEIFYLIKSFFLKIN
jgi:hypothetical protein